LHPLEKYTLVVLLYGNKFAYLNFFQSLQQVCALLMQGAHTQYKTVGVHFLSGLRELGSRTNILVGGQERSPKTQPFHIVKRLATMQKNTQYTVF